MSVSRKTALVLSFVAGALLLGTPAFAHDNGRWHNNDNYNYRYYDRSGYHDRYDNDRYRRVEYYQVNLTPRQWQDARRYMNNAYWDRCNNRGRYSGCQTYGRQVYFNRGDYLPRHINTWQVPHNVLTILPPAPRGARYVWVDRDVLLVRDNDLSILDVIRLITG